MNTIYQVLWIIVAAISLGTSILAASKGDLRQALYFFIFTLLSCLLFWRRRKMSRND